MSKAVQTITNFAMVILACLTILFVGMGISEMIDGMKVYTYSEDSFCYALEDGRYGDLVSYYHKNMTAGVKSAKTLEKYYAIAAYYEAALDYQLAVLDNDEDLQMKLHTKMSEAADHMGELSYAKEEIDHLFEM